MKIIPTVPEIAAEGIKMFAGILVAAWLLSRFPKLKEFVEGNSLTIKDQAGNNLYF